MIGKVTNMMQAELGQAALEVRETVLGGMKMLGCMSYDAAESRVSGGGGDVGRVGDGLVSGGRFVSRNAPHTSEGDEGAAQRLRVRRFSNASTIFGHHITTVAPSTTSTTTVAVITSPCLISLLCWFLLGRKWHHLLRMLFCQSRLMSSCLLTANLFRLSISQPAGQV